MPVKPSAVLLSGPYLALSVDAHIGAVLTRRAVHHSVGQNGREVVAHRLAGQLARQSCGYTAATQL